MDRLVEKQPLMEDPSYADDSDELPMEKCYTRHWMVFMLRRVVAEMLGTCFLMLSACGSIMAGLDTMGQAIAVAFSLVMVISSLGHVSGAHLNPAISVAFAATKLFPWSQVPWYFAAQLAGGTSAMLLAKLLYNAGEDAALTEPAGGGWAQAFVMELVLTFGLSFVATATSTQPNFDGIQGAVAIALTVAMNMMLGGDISGASMNPVRSLAPAIVQNNFKGIWIYLIAPMVGAIMGAFSYKLIQIDPIYKRKISQCT